MLVGGAVAGFAAHAGDDRFQVQAAAGDRAGRVAAEAVARVDGVHAAAGRVVDVPGLALLRAHGEIEAAQGIVEADAAFVEGSVAFEYVGLSGLAAPEGP